MLPDWAYDYLRCPVSSETLLPAPQKLVDELILQQSRGELLNAEGFLCEDPFDGGLVNHSGTWFHAIRQGIPTLIPGEAIPLAQHSDNPSRFGFAN